MAEDPHFIKGSKKQGDSTLKFYVLGFVLSAISTIAAYVVVVKRYLPSRGLVFTIAGLAIIQTLVQLVFFLHLGSERKPRWNLLVFSFMTLIVVILVFGSLWIMYSLNYRMMEPMALKVHTELERSFREDA